MTAPTVPLKTFVVQNCLNWFKMELRQKLISPLEIAFPNFPLLGEIQATQRRLEQILQTVGPIQQNTIDLVNLVQREWSADPSIGSLFKTSLLLYRRHRAAYLEGLRAKTFDPELANALFQEIDDLDAAVNNEWLQSIAHTRLPRLKEYLSLPFLEESSETLAALPPRQYDEKFRILYAPTLFLRDLAYFRAKCEVRDTPVAIAFLDIDDFKAFNEKYSETFVDRSLLPRLMQAIEAHVHHHGYGYRQGGDEYLLLLPNLSQQLTISFLDELRRKLADLDYPGIQEKTKLSIGICIADPDCPLTDQELLSRANEAKKFAKRRKNCLATFQGPRLIPEELRIVEEELTARRQA